MNPNLVTIDISDETSMLQACDLLHDGRFELGTATPDIQAGTWKGIFIRQFFENECQAIRGKYWFLFCEDMEIVLSFREKPSGRLRDVRLLDERGSYSTLRNPFRRRRKGS
jgi:hypothetical protein